ncbi:NAD kinase [Bernardetia sp.]|uniref:NAD kinase n=1 Tax=Bernardetia sp. TaxID=1937974 RepID=UPI0025C631BE|nr:NAD kinase [Bernardetia sp.]
MKKVAIHSKDIAESKLFFIKQIFTELENYGVEIIISKDFDRLLHSINFRPNIVGVFSAPHHLIGVDLMLSVGGDGTFLESATIVQHQNVPILGINTGRLGFLATTSKEQIHSAIESLMAGHYELDERILLELEADRDLFKGVNIALNEFAIMKRDSSSMIVVHTYIDGEYLNSYWADGLIVATPTGSTGYSLSVGGPVVVPQSNNFIISPVSPHNLNVRPLIVPTESVIAFEIEGRSKNFLVSLDSRSRKVDSNVQLAVRKCNYTCKMVRLDGDSFLKTLREKLNWGNDIRNYLNRY